MRGVTHLLRRHTTGVPEGATGASFCFQCLTFNSPSFPQPERMRVAATLGMAGRRWEQLAVKRTS